MSDVLALMVYSRLLHVALTCAIEPNWNPPEPTNVLVWGVIAPLFVCYLAEKPGSHEQETHNASGASS